MKERSVTIAGRAYALRYTLESRHDIEKETKKGIFEAMFSGEIGDQAAVLAAGLKHDDKGITTQKVIRLLETHQHPPQAATYEPGDYEDVVREAYRAVFEARLLGQVKDEAALLKLLGYDGEEGKAQPSAS